MDLMEDAVAQQEFFKPEELSAEDNHNLCAMLEALFGTTTDADKQEFPIAMAELVAKVIGVERTVLVINGGDGSTVKALSPAHSFGIETVEKLARKRAGSYNALVGDPDKLLELLEPLRLEFNDIIVVLREEGLSPERSMELAQAITDEHDDDSYVVVFDKGNANAEWLRANLPGVWAKLDLTDVDAQVWFAAHPKKITKLDAEAELPTRTATTDVIDLLAPWVTEQRDAAKPTQYVSWYRGRNTYSCRDTVDIFKATQREYGRRFVAKEQRFDVGLVARKIVDFTPSDWARRVLGAMNRDLSHLHKRPREWFAQNAGFYDELVILEDKGILRIDPIFHMYVLPIVEASKRATTPLRTPRPQERLGHLHQVSEIKCIEEDEEKNLVEGKWYRVQVVQESYEIIRDGTKPNKKTGGLDATRFKRQYRRQRIKIDSRHTFYDDDAENIEYLLRHFAIPDPGDVKAKYPALYAAEMETLNAVEERYLIPRGFAFKRYQKDDLARVGMKGRAVLAHEQGMGKTLEGLAFVMAEREKAGKDVPALIVAPQDLIPQWQAEAKKFYGVELVWIGRHKGGGRFNDAREDGPAAGSIKNLIEARDIARKLRVDPFSEPRIFITHFEALTGGKNHLKVEEPYTVRMEKKWRKVPGGYRMVDGVNRYFYPEEQPYEVEVSSAKECPCGKELDGALTCPKCGHTRVIYKLPTIGSILSGAFRQGVVVVDEGTQIASSRNSNEKTSSNKTKAVAALRAKHRLVMSGTPIKNFISQAFWLLWWSIGNKSERFPYGYGGGKADFAEDFAVFEWELNPESGQWTNKKTVGETTNPGRLWAQLGSVLLRRTKDETGELIVQRKTHIIEVPNGYRQREQMQFWMDNFPAFYIEKHPDDPKVKRPEVLASMAPMLGLDVKLNYAAILPKADPDWEWTGVPVSNYTPVALKTLETVMSLLKQGRKVLIGTDIKAASGWIASELEAKGVKVATMLDGSGQTIDPPKRADVVRRFQESEVEIISSTIKAIRLGHNLDKGSAVVFFGLTWDYEEFSQFRDRVHRLTSEAPVDVYVIVPGEKNSSIVGRKWEVITDKTKGAALALDGQLPEMAEVPVETLKADALRELMEKGIPVTGNEVHEHELEAKWMELASFEDFKAPDDFTKGQAVPWHIDWVAAEAAHAEYADEQERIEAEREQAEFLALWESAIREDAERTLAWETVLEWAYAEDERFIPVTLAPVEPEPTVEDDEEVAVVTFSEPLAPVPVQPVSDPAPSPVASMTADLISQLTELKELLDIGVLDADEFKEAKGAIIAQMKSPAARATTATIDAEGEPQLALAI
jgi:hypothetical protein